MGPYVPALAHPPGTRQGRTDHPRSGREVHPVQGASADELTPGDQFGLDAWHQGTNRYVDYVEVIDVGHRAMEAA
ncbi:hypothetical protein GCM10023080_034700 [Streptomyces pseudoechinosporeus]